MYDEILVPTDGSEAAEAAIEHALELAGQYGGRIHGLYVVDTSIAASADVGSEVLIDSLEKEGETALERLSDRVAAADVPMTTETVRGNPHRQIVSYVEDHDIDLVVMGTHGRSGVERFLLGSVTERVVRSCDAPVLVVRAQAAE